MVVVFASTAGLTGAEVGIAGGSAVLGQKLLEAVFGDQAVRRLADAGPGGPRRAGSTRCSTQERARFTRPSLDAPASRPGGVRSGCGAPARRVDDLRFAGRARTRPTDRAVAHRTVASC